MSQWLASLRGSVHCILLQLGVSWQVGATYNTAQSLLLMMKLPLPSWYCKSSSHQARPSEEVTRPLYHPPCLCLMPFVKLVRIFSETRHMETKARAKRSHVHSIPTILVALRQHGYWNVRPVCHGFRFSFLNTCDCKCGRGWVLTLASEFLWSWGRAL